jgi:uncharacterized protein (TIGR02147 family)
MKAKELKEFNIFDYTDYKTLLRDYYDFQKKVFRHFSFRYFAQKAGVSASVYKDIVAGRRRLSLDVMRKYAVAMNLTQKEIDYFEVITNFVNSNKNAEKNDCFNTMMRMRGNFMMKFITAKQYEFYQNWYHSAIRELITLPDFREDYAWIGNRCFPKVSTTCARKSIELMLELGIIARNDAGKLALSDAVISTEYEMKSFFLRNFHSEMLTLAKEALERFEPDEREISSLTLGISQACYDRIKDRIRTFKQELITMAVEDESISETVCQCNFQLFPLVKKAATGKSEPV